jgi:hypothetical protein
MSDRIHVRARMLRIIAHSVDPVSCYHLVRAFNGGARALAKDELSNIISEGVVNLIGTGRRGSPYKVVKGSSWPVGICPLCGKPGFQS